MPTCYLSKICRAIGADDKNVGVDEEVFSVAASDVEADGSCGEALEKLFYDRPGFVARGGEVRCDLLVDGVDVCFFVVGG